MKSPVLYACGVALLLGIVFGTARAQRYDPNNPNSPMQTPAGMKPMPTRIGPGYPAAQPTVHFDPRGVCPTPSAPSKAYGCVGNTVISLGYGAESIIVFGAPDLNTGLIQYPQPWGYLGWNGYLEVVPGTLTILPTAPQYVYTGGYLAFTPGTYDVQAAPQPVYNVYNQYTTNNYYYANSAPAVQPVPGAPVQANRAAETSALAPDATIDDSAFLAQAFKDISRSWLRSDIALFKKYLSSDVKVDVLSQGVYEYSLASDKLAAATDSVYDHLATQSFDFQVLRSLRNGDITAYAKHVYFVRGGDASGSKTMYVSYTMGKRNSAWVIVAIDSSSKPLVPDISSSAAPPAAGVAYSTDVR